MGANLNCLNGIITDNLAIHIDLTSLGSWNLNTGLTSISLTKWSKAVSDDIDLIDYGLTEFDNGRTNKMYEGINVKRTDTKLVLDKVGYNFVKNPTTGETSGSTVTTKFDLYPISGITSTTGNYFKLNGGYLQGYFKLSDYNFEIFPPRCNDGITIETIINIQSYSQGIFYMMGIRAEDKYNHYFSGETLSGKTTAGKQYFSGVTASEGNTYESFTETTVTKKAFSKFEDKNEILYSEPPQIDNIKGNVIAFELTQDKRLAYKYVDDNGELIYNVSPNPITMFGWSIVSISFIPDNFIADVDLMECTPRRTGKMIFYVNGRVNWIIHDFPEFKFNKVINHRDLQIGVPYSISWGGGSFGLKHSWHYDYQTYSLYNNQNNAYINNKFVVESNPLPAICDPYSGGTILSGLKLSADTTSFHYHDECNNISHPEPVMRITYTGATGNTGSTYFIKFDQPITVLSNREYDINLELFNDKFFKTFSINGSPVKNKVSIVVYGTTDIDILEETVYYDPIDSANISQYTNIGLKPFPDRQQYEYITGGDLYYGATGIPVGYGQNYLYSNLSNVNPLSNTYVTGESDWKSLSTKFRMQNNSGKQQVYIGVLIETDYGLNQNKPLFINNFTYTGQDILVQDNTNKITIIEDYFDSSYIGDIQKLRVYDRGLTSPEILHNAIMETSWNPSFTFKVVKGGRIINLNGTGFLSNLQWVTGYMYNQVLMYNYKIWNNN